MNPLAWYWQYSAVLEALFFFILAIREPVVLAHISKQLLIPSAGKRVCRCPFMVSFTYVLKMKDDSDWLTRE